MERGAEAKTVNSVLAAALRQGYSGPTRPHPMAAYEDTTAVSALLDRHEPLERLAAMVLGLLVLVHSRLDVGLGQWVAGALPADTLRQKLERLRGQLPAMSEARRAGFEALLRQCDDLALLRDERVHGRWVADVRSGRLVSLGGAAPAEPLACSMEDLQEALESLRQIEVDLQALRSAA
jgi:hypothetical protein